MAHTIGASVNGIVTRSALDLITTNTTGQCIVPVTTVDHIVTVTTGHKIITAQRVNELPIGRSRVTHRGFRRSVSVLGPRHGRRAPKIGQIIGPIKVLERLLNTGTGRRGDVCSDH